MASSDGRAGPPGDVGLPALSPEQRNRIERLLEDAVVRQDRDLAALPSRLVPLLPGGVRDTVGRILGS